jgi:hypothetical protein
MRMAMLMCVPMLVRMSMAVRAVVQVTTARPCVAAGALGVWRMCGHSPQHKPPAEHFKQGD